MIATRILFLAALLLLTPVAQAGSSNTAVGGNPAKFAKLKYKNKPFFPIGAWFEGRPSWASSPGDPAKAKPYYDRSFADLAAHGFNTVAVPNCPEELWETLLQSAQRNGIKVVLEILPLSDLISKPEPVNESEVRAIVKRVVGKIGKYDSLLRYQIKDEPPKETVPNWLTVQRILAAADPKRPAFSCFCNADSLASVTRQTNLSEAVFDIYPLSVKVPSENLGKFVASLDNFKSAAQGNTSWAVLQAFAKPESWRYPSPGELRAMTWLSLASGVKGIFFFIYQTLPDHPEKLQGLVNAQGAPTHLYTVSSSLAREMGHLAPLLLSLKTAPAQASLEAGSARLGSFVDKQGRPVLIIANSQPDAAVRARLKLASPDTAWTDLTQGVTLTPKDGLLELTLGPGCGRILVRGKLRIEKH